MPLIEIHTAAVRSKAEKQKLMTAARNAVCEAFAVETAAATVWLREYAPEDVLSSSGAECLTQYVIHCFSGRSQRQKEKLFSLLYEYLRAIGEDVSEFQVTIEETPLENWGLYGGQSAAALREGAGQN